MPEKICVICGEDCSGRPRTKDPRGRYYCNTCYEAARAGTHSTAATSGAADPPGDVFGLENDDDMAFDMLDEIAPGGAAAAQAAPCPECGSAIPVDGVICTTCGYNTQTGQSLQVKTTHPGAQFAEFMSDAKRYVNPTTVGLGAIAIYVLLLLLYLGLGDNPAILVAFSLWDFVFRMTAIIVILFVAFQTSIAQGLLTLCVPCYVLYFIVAVTDSQWARWLFVAGFLGVLIGLPMLIALREFPATP